MSDQERVERTQALIPALELLPELPESDSIWGSIDVLNTKESSQATLSLVKQLIDATGLSEGIYVARRWFYPIDPEEYRSPLQVFDAYPDNQSLPSDDWVHEVCGPLKYSEAIAVGYLLETAIITDDILYGVTKMVDYRDDPTFEEIAKRIGGQKRFIPLGVLTFCDYLIRMMNYRRIKDELGKLDVSEEEDLVAGVVGLGIIPLARAFKEDDYKVGRNYQEAIDRFYVGNTNLFIPYAGVYGGEKGQPRTDEDWQMVGLGLYTGVRLFRLIEERVSEEREN